MGNQPLVASDDPGQVTDAGGLAHLQGKGDGEASRIAERLRARRPKLQFLGGRKPLADSLGFRQIEAEQIAGVGVLSDVDMLQTFA